MCFSWLGDCVSHFYLCLAFHLLIEPPFGVTGTEMTAGWLLLVVRGDILLFLVV